MLLPEEGTLARLTEGAYYNLKMRILQHFRLDSVMLTEIQDGTENPMVCRCCAKRAIDPKASRSICFGSS